MESLIIEPVLGVKLGSGSFGSVYAAPGDRNTVIKVCKGDPVDVIDYARIRECAAFGVLNQCPAPYFVRLQQTYRYSATKHALLLDRFDGSLADKLNVTDTDIRSILFQVLNAVLYLHNRNLLHRDLKDRNVLQTGDRVSLCDFGSVSSTYAYSEHSAQLCQHHHTAAICTLTHRPPEVFLGATQYSAAVDVWALGVLLAELYLGNDLFWNFHEQNSSLNSSDAPEEIIHTFHNICKCFGLERMSTLQSQPRYTECLLETNDFYPPLYQHGFGLAAYIEYRRSDSVRYTDNITSQEDGFIVTQRPAFIPTDALDLLSHMLQPDPTQRWSVGALLAHPYFRGRLPLEPVLYCPIEKVQLMDDALVSETTYNRPAITEFFYKIAQALRWTNKHTLFGVLEIAHRFLGNRRSSVLDLIGLGIIAENLFEVKANDYETWLQAADATYTVSQIKQCTQPIEFALKHDYIRSTEWMYILAFCHNTSPDWETLQKAETLLLASLSTLTHSTFTKRQISSAIYEVAHGREVSTILYEHLRSAYADLLARKVIAREIIYF
jgi:serine/threonine protein kinase